MAPSDNQVLDDEHLRRYLLGALPEADAERFHELSLSNEQLAGRLDAVENDLVDAYVRGELSEDNLKQFKAFYLSSPKRRQKVQFAEGLLALERRVASAPDSAKERPVPSPSRQASRDRSSTPMVAFRPFGFQWGLAAASLALLVAGGYLLFQNLGLRKQMTDAQAQHTSADQRLRDLESRLDQERSAKDQALRELEKARESQPNLDQLKTVSLLLPPPMRGPGPIPTISLHPGTDLVVLVLPLEWDDFPAYHARLRDPVANRVLWSSAKLTASQGGERKMVSASFPASLLKQQNYLVDLTGVPTHGAAEVISSYTIRVVLE